MAWSAQPLETRMLYSQIAIKLTDEFTGKYPIHDIYTELAIQRSTGAWQPLEVGASFSQSGNILFPGLGLNANVGVAPLERYRVSISSDAYIPEYRRTVDALEFNVHPYDHSNPPAVIPTVPDTLLLLPSVNYQFSTHVRVLRGQTVDGIGEPIPYAEITEGVRERVLSDERGTFALPLRWPVMTGPVTVDAIDHRTGRTDSLVITLPDDLLSDHTFTLT